jgi:hypothetical protein
MRKTIFYAISILVVLAVSLPAQVPSRTSLNDTTPPWPFYVHGFVQYKGFNLKTCDSSINVCTDVQAQCGKFTYSGISIGIPPENIKSQYSADIPGDISGTPEIEGCATGDQVTFTIKGELAEQSSIPWETGGMKDYDLSFGTPNLVFLPLIGR